MLKIKIFFVCGALLMLCACSPSTLPPYAKIQSLRVLALKASTPEVSPGDAIPTVSALVLDPNGGGRTVTYSWVGCTEPVSPLTTRYDCQGATDTVSLGSGTTSQAGGAVIPSTILSTTTTAQNYNGVAYIVSLSVTAGSESVKAFKRIVVSQSSKTSKNSNPSITSFLRNDVALNSGDAIGSAEGTLRVDLPTSNFESYTYIDGTGQNKAATEDLLVTWFYTEGVMYSSRTFGGKLTNLWTPPATKVLSTVTLAVVVHDGRGGIDWRSVDLQ